MPAYLINFDRNRYSVSALFANHSVSLRVYPHRLVIENSEVGSNGVVEATFINDNIQTPWQEAPPVRGVMHSLSWELRPLLALTGPGEGFSFGDTVNTHDNVGPWCQCRRQRARSMMALSKSLSGHPVSSSRRVCAVIRFGLWLSRSTSWPTRSGPAHSSVLSSTGTAVLPMRT